MPTGRRSLCAIPRRAAGARDADDVSIEGPGTTVDADETRRCADKVAVVGDAVEDTAEPRHCAVGDAA